MNPASLRNACRAFTLIELLVVVVIIGVMIAMLFPAYDSRSIRAPTVMCINNLRQTGVGFMIWATEHEDKLPWQVSTNTGGLMELVPSGIAADHFLTLTNYLKQPRGFWCPTDKTRAAVESFSEFSNTNLSYFVALVTITNGAFAVLAGDRHLQLKGKPVKSGFLWTTNIGSTSWTRELHPQMPVATGNLLLIDGHVESVETKNLPAVFQRQAIATNRLVIP